MNRPVVVTALLIALAPMTALGHDIPNQRVDRAIQITVEPGLLRVDYEVSLSELTLTQDLRGLGETLTQGDRQGWFDLYAKVVGPLNAKGLLATVDSTPITLEYHGHDLEIREHPRYLFHLRGVIPPSGRLSLRDSNYASSEGTSRLAVRAGSGARLAGYSGPANVEDVPIQPTWMLSNEDERLTKEVEATYTRSAGIPLEPTRASPPSATTPIADPALSRLLDRSRGGLLWLLAIMLGALHALQPGHGKTLAAACAIAPGARAGEPVLLGLATGLAHAASVMVIALALWLTRSSSVVGLHQGLAGVAGFVIAAAGLWKLGRAIGGHELHEHRGPDPSRRAGSIGLGMAVGLVPCWDAVALLVLAAAIGRLGEGIALVLAFCLGMTAALAGLGWLVWKLGAPLVERLGGRMARASAAIAGLAATAVGLVLFLA